MPIPVRELTTLSTLDPRAPFVLATHELGRRPGSTQRVAITVPAPAGLDLGGVVGVPEAADVELDLRLESVMEGVLVSGTVRAPYSGECVRCLEPVDGEVVAEVQELYVYPERADDPDTETDDEELRVEDDLIDLEQPVRDAVVLTLPQSPVCRDDCPGLCPDCGARLADDPDHAHESTDPRWAALAGLVTDDTNESGSHRAGPTEEN
ncbi:metal-binding protein [Jiangella anatolica]|uniref:Metal-binding protein n=1 Tax=Jiangella anatolica TaxID=2670374 RepID=A0A2W2C4Y6_9ACTN|nr:metal-binding protein [Jiangella anatolica]